MPVERIDILKYFGIVRSRRLYKMVVFRGLQPNQKANERLSVAGQNRTREEVSSTKRTDIQQSRALHLLPCPAPGSRAQVAINGSKCMALPPLPVSPKHKAWRQESSDSKEDPREVLIPRRAWPKWLRHI